MTTSTTFINKSGYPIIVEGWVQTIPDLHSIEEVCVQNDEIKVVSSTTNLWNLHCMFRNKDDIAKWSEFGNVSYIAKFGTQPCYKGEYSWMEYANSIFAIIYDKSENTFTFIKKN